MTKIMEHRTDLIEGYVLNALDHAERSAVEEHIAVCSSCRKLAQVSQESLEMLALTARPAPPPLRCKRTVLERIEREQFLHKATPRPAQRRMPVTAWTTMAAMLLWVMTGGWAFNLQRELASMQSEMALQATQTAQMQQQTAHMQQQLTQFVSFDQVLADGDTICVLKESQIKAKCYAQPGDNEAVMVVSGLPPLEGGKIYKLWLAHDDVQEPLDAFTPVDGTARLHFAPPEPLERYTDIMITVEDAPEVTEPSETTVLAGKF